MADKVTKLILKLSLFPESENEDENTKVTKSHQTLRNPSCQVDNKYTQVLDSGSCKISKDMRTHSKIQDNFLDTLLELRSST